MKSAAGGVALVVALALLSPISPLHAEEPGGGGNCIGTCPIAAGNGSVIDVTYTRGQSEKVPHRDGHGAANVTATWTRVDEEMAPTCSANTRGGDLTLCGAAVNSCPDGLIRFWVWHQVTTFTRQANGTITSEVTTPWYQEPGSFCLGADDPGVPVIARVIDLIRSQFTSLPITPRTIRADPAPTTLVNVETAFSAGSTEPQVFTPTLLGTTVTVTAKPVRWIWQWGDGTTDAYDRPGTPQQPDVTHVYTRAADREVRLTVEWRGTFRVGSDPTEYAITTPAYVQSAPITVRVRQARSQLVR